MKIALTVALALAAATPALAQSARGPFAPIPRNAVIQHDAGTYAGPGSVGFYSPTGRAEDRIATDQAFPLELKVPNAETRAAMEEVEQLKARGRARFDNADDMFASLDEESGKLRANEKPGN